MVGGSGRVQVKDALEEEVEEEMGSEVLSLVQSHSAPDFVQDFLSYTVLSLPYMLTIMQ